MKRFKMAKFFILFALMAMSVSSQPIEPLTTSGTGGVLALLKNLGQVVLETFLEWAKRGFAMPQISKKLSNNHLILLVNNLNIRLEEIEKTLKRPQMMSKINFRNLTLKIHKEYLICSTDFVWPKIRFSNEKAKLKI